MEPQKGHFLLSFIYKKGILRENQKKNYTIKLKWNLKPENRIEIVYKNRLMAENDFVPP